MTRKGTRLVLTACSLGFGLVPGCAKAPEARPPHIVIILVDQLRADRVGFGGANPSTTPNLDQLARRSFVFSAARSAAPWTFPSVGSLLTGVYPSTHRAGRAAWSERKGSWLSPLPPGVPTLSELLRKKGYATAGFVTNPYLKPEGGASRGFEHYEHDFVRSWAIVPGDSHDEWWLRESHADAVNRRVVAWAKQERRRPQFIYVHYIDVHGPWHFAPFLSEAERARVKQNGSSPADQQFLDEVYDRAIRFIDTQITGLLSDLAWIHGPNQMVVVTSDHGRSLGEADRASLKINKGSLHDLNLKVPLLFVDGKARFRGTSGEGVSLVDVVPTVLELAGAEPDYSQLHGRSLIALLRGRGLERRAIFAEVNDPSTDSDMQAMVVAATKYMNVAKPHAARLVYDLVQDPGENHPREVPLAGPEEAEFAVMHSAFQHMTGAQGHGAAMEVPPETVERLKALGYLP